MLYHDSTYHTGSNAAQDKKVRAGSPTLRDPAENMQRRPNRTKLLNFAEWNVRTLLDNKKIPKRHTALVTKELKRYNIDVAALCKTRFSSSGSLIEHDYTMYWSGKKEG